MSEFSSASNEPTLNEQAKAEIVGRTREQLGWLNEAAEAIAGKGAEVSETFDLPSEVRDDAPMPDWTEVQEAEVREIARRFGYGAEQNVPSGLQGGVRIAEGGKIWKMMAEAKAIDDEDRPSDLIFAGSPFRPLGEDEIDFLRDKYNVSLAEGATEYDAARWAAEGKADEFIAEEPEVLDIGYEISEGNPVVHEPTGQLVQIGETSDGQNILLLRVDREIYEDKEGKQKYRHQPDTARIMGILSEVLTTQDRHEDPIGLVTSNTYASRQANAIRAGLANGRHFGVAMYGRETLRELNAPVPKETPLNQLPGDLRLTYDNLQKLMNELEQAG